MERPELANKQMKPDRQAFGFTVLTFLLFPISYSFSCPHAFIMKQHIHLETVHRVPLLSLFA
jgi:hypothetical protein